MRGGGGGGKSGGESWIIKIVPIEWDDGMPLPHEYLNLTLKDKNQIN